VTAFAPQLDIVVWAPRAASVSQASALSRALFDEAAKQGLHLALADLPVSFFDMRSTSMKADRETITCLRSVLMKPEHREWVDRIAALIDSAAAKVLA
jgi:RNase H-fold protein (predicted Holliday junction resolvase)